VSLPPKTGERRSLDAEIGYLEQGEVIYLAFEGSAMGVVECAATIVEWAPRRAPLRVQRGKDGLLDVREPAAPLRPVDIPAERWVTVPAQATDATAAILKALAQADAQRKPGEYAGIRLERGRRYVVGSAQNGGSLFELKDLKRLVFDGNGATLQLTSPEMQRKGVDLWSRPLPDHRLPLDGFRGLDCGGSGRAVRHWGNP
jgi:hypothetical protein